MIAFSSVKDTPGFSSVNMLTKDYSQKTGTPTNIIRFTGSPAAFFETLETFKGDKNLQQYLKQREDRGNTWLGLAPSESIPDYIRDKTLQSATDAAKNAKSAIQTTFTRAQYQPTFTGSVYSMGRIIQGHPKPCLRRPKTKLPPKNIDIFAGFSAGVDASEITPIFARINNAAIVYTLAGGIVNLRINYISGLSRANEKHTAVMLSLNMPTSNLATLAGVCGGQFYRTLFLPFAKAFSPVYDDGLPSVRVAFPGALLLDGKEEKTRAVLAALKIT